MGNSNREAPRVGDDGVQGPGLQWLEFPGRKGYIVREPTGRVVCDVLDCGQGQAMRQLGVLACGCLLHADHSPVYASPEEALEVGGFSTLTKVAELAGRMSGLQIGLSMPGSGEGGEGGEGN